MRIGNGLVKALLRSPLHGILSGSTDVIRYTGRRSAETFTTPTQYAQRDDEIIILVGRPETKTWWRNFREDRDIDVLIRGRWLRMSGRAVVGAEEPDVIRPLLAAYLARFPKAARSLEGATPDARAQHAVVVWCRPR
jgi:hypothetical protein